MNADLQPRLPVGTPGAGRWKEGEHAPSPVTLGTPVKLYDRMDGTYLHPAPSATAEHCINFWANVEVPDEIITQVENAYYNDRQQEISDDMEAAMYDWTQQWVNENPEPRKAGPDTTERYNQRFRNEHEAYRQQILPEVESRRPIVLRGYNTPQVIRVAQMALHRPDPDKFPDEYVKVQTYPVELIEGELKVHEIMKKYMPSRIHQYITSLVKDDNEALMLEAIGQTNELLSAWQYERSEDRLAAQEEQY